MREDYLDSKVVKLPKAVLLSAALLVLIFLGTGVMIVICSILKSGPLCALLLPEKRDEAVGLLESGDESAHGSETSEWTQWGKCNAKCDNGNQTRIRSGARPEVVEQRQSRPCSAQASCKAKLYWTSWGPWSGICSKNCSFDGDVQGRVLRCQTEQLSLVDPDNCQVGVLTAENRTCNSIGVCPIVCNNPAICGPVPGGWGQWDRWSSCLITCGPGLRVRKRRCDNPAPRNGGADCGNHTLDFSDCLRFGKCPVDGAWGLWSPCTHGLDCNRSTRGRCQSGERMLCRYCNDPKPSMGGSICIRGFPRKFVECWNVDACNNSVLQPPMNFTVVGFPDSSRLTVRWRRAPYGRPATTFYLAWAVDDGSRASGVFIPVGGQQTLGESYEHRIDEEFLANSTVNFGIESWSEADGGVSERLKLSFRVSRVGGV